MNIYDIAKEAGVSIGTVSRVVNNKGYVSEKTRKKIQEVLDRTEYQPSAIARGLVAGSMKTIAIFAVDVRVPHYATTSYIMEQLLREQGYMVLLCNTGDDPRIWRQYLTRIEERKVDGIILTGSIYNQLEGDDVFNSLGNLPIVMANGKIDRPNVKSIIVDEGHGMELAAAHLLSRGHKRLAYVVDKPTEAASRKKDGFLRHMLLNGFPDARNDVYHCEYSMEAGAKIAVQLYKNGYDAILFGEDLTAVGAVGGLLDEGVRIPEEIAVTGCNNSEYSVMCRPKLTSVNNKAEVLSELTVKLLVDTISKKKETAHLVVLPELVVRETT